MSLAELRLTQLYVIMRDDRVPDRDRLEASKEILSRRFGPPKAVTEAVGSIPTGWTNRFAISVALFALQSPGRVSDHDFR